MEQFRIKTDGRGFAYVLMYDGRADYIDNGRIIRISPDGKVMETVVKTTFEAASPLNACFTVGNDDSLYTFCGGNQMRIYNPEGKQIWRNAAAREADLKSNSKE